jgi:hypothetical protein
MAREGLPCTWRKRYPHLKTNAFATERQRTFESFYRRQESYSPRRIRVAPLVMLRGNGEVGGSDNRHMSTTVADDTSAEPRVRFQGYDQVPKPLPGPRVHCRSLFQGWGWGTTGIAPQRAISTL